MVLETLWPTRCAVCDAPGEKVLCDECESQLLPVDSCEACPVCGAPYGRIQCTECNDVVLKAAGADEFPMEGMEHALVLDDAARRIVSIYKDADERRLCGVIASFMARYVSPELRREGYVVTFVPDTKEAFRRRGFDHSREIATEVASLCGMECVQLLRRPKSTDQRKLGRRERILNMKERMNVMDGVDVPERILLVDDVCTTGATLFSATLALKGAGAQHVRALTFGQVLD